MTPEKLTTPQTDLICLSHLRWGFVFQRPQHLMCRFAKTRRVFFVEEPEYGENPQPGLRREVCARTGVIVVTPTLPETQRGTDVTLTLRLLLDQLISREKIRRHVAWYYTPMALDFASHLKSDV